MTKSDCRIFLFQLDSPDCSIIFEILKLFRESSIRSFLFTP